MKEIIIKFINRFWVLRILYVLRNKLIRLIFINPRKTKIYNYFLSNNEYNKFLKAKKLNKKYLFIYDNSVSSPGLGDFLYFLYSIRSLIDENDSIEVVITNSKLNSRWDSLIYKNKLGYYFDQQIYLSKKFLNDYKFNLSIINTEELVYKLKKNNKNYIFFDSFVSSHLRIYDQLFNFINIVFKRTGSLKFIIKNSEFISDLPKEMTPRNYLTIGFRYSNLWRKESNNTREQINRIINQVRLFSKLDIVILSDELGTRKCKEYIKNNKHISSIKFSKDFCNSFIEDGAILTNSRSYFQFKAGGLGAFALFSNVPYLIFSEYNHELKFSRNNCCTWAKNNQVYINSTELDLFIKFISLKKNILFI